MTSAKHISVGKLGKPHGLNGAFRFLLWRELKGRRKPPLHFLLNINGNFLPWFIKNIEWTGFDQGIILFDETISPEQAKQFSGSELLMAEKDINTYFKKNTQNIDYLIGYKIIDKVKGEVGIVEEITDNPGQILLTVKKAGKEFMLPFVEDFVIHINKRKKEILLNLPEGLLEL